MFESDGADESLVDMAIDAGADDVDTAADGSVEVITEPEDFHHIKEVFVEAGFNPVLAEVGMIPQNYTDLTPDNSEKLLRLIDLLEDIDDVTNIYTNGNFATENNE